MQRRRMAFLLPLALLLVSSSCSSINLLGTSNPELAPAPVVEIDRSVVTAEAVIEPAEWWQVSYAAGGTVEEVLVSEGDRVEVGQIVARLDSEHQAAAVAQAEAALRKAEARLAELRAGPRQEEIDVALTAVVATQVQLVRLEEAARPQELAPAEAALAVAEASLQKVREGASEETVIAARADLANAQALQRQAQAAYDRVRYQPHVAALPEALALEQATNTVIAAQAALDELESGPSAADLAIASAQVRQAQAQLELLKLDARPGDIAVANAAIAQAEAQLDLLQAPLRPETIAVAAADVAAAEVALQQAQLALEDMELRAPVAGTVTDIRLQVGDQAAPGLPLLVLASLDEFNVRTVDLRELDVGRLRVGQPVEIEVDALRDVLFKGTVQQIALQAGNHHGDVVYDVTIDLQPSQSRELLKWGMTAVVRVRVGE